MPRIYLFATVVSALLSTWAAIAEMVPNPDAVLYLRAAEFFARGEWHDALATYRWPFYSLLISIVMGVTGTTAFVAAQIVNAALTLGTTIVLIRLAHLLSNGDRVVVIVAAIVFAFHPQLTDMRAWVIRDHGYLLFSMSAIFCTVADSRNGSIRWKIGAVLSIVFATLFRIEGIYLGLLCGSYALLTRAKSRQLQVATIAFLAIAATGLVPLAFGLWKGGSVSKLVSGDFYGGLSPFVNDVVRRVGLLEDTVLAPWPTEGWAAYISMAIGIALYGMIRALTPVFSVVGFFAFVPRCVIPRQAVAPLLWFAVGQLPILIGFAFLNAFLTWRHAMGFALLASFATVFCVAASWRELTILRPRAFLVFPAIAIALVVTWVADLPRPTSLGYYKDAGIWIRANVDPSERLWMNEARVAYFADRDFRQVSGVAESLGFPPPQFIVNGEKPTIFVVSSGEYINVPPLPVPREELQSVMKFEGKAGQFVEILAPCGNRTDCG